MVEEFFYIVKFISVKLFKKIDCLKDDNNCSISNSSIINNIAICNNKLGERFLGLIKILKVG